jgi:hypothetical protein
VVDGALFAAQDSIAAYRRLVAAHPAIYVADHRDALELAIALAESSGQEQMLQQLEGELESFDQRMQEQE